MKISTVQYKAKTKSAEKRRDNNRQQLRSYYTSIEREIEAAAFGTSDKEEFLVTLDTDFEVSKQVWVKGFKSYALRIFPPAVASNGKMAALKKDRMICIVGSMAKQSLEIMVQQAAKEFNLKVKYYQTKGDAPPALQDSITAEAGLLISGVFYPLITKRRTRDDLAFRNQKDVRRAVMAELAPEYAVIDDSWSCSFKEMMRIQRSVDTLADWSIDDFEKTKELNARMKEAKQSIEQTYMVISKARGFGMLIPKIEGVREKFNQINKEYEDAKDDWKKAIKLRLKEPRLSIQMQADSMRKVEQCGRRIDVEVTTELENALKSDTRISRLEPVKNALDKVAYATDWAQRLVFLAAGLMSVVHP